MGDSENFVIVGAGMAGAKGAEALRNQGFDGRITLLGDESHRPYERPPLSKEYLMGGAEFDSAYVHPESWYADNDVDLRLNTSARHVDRALRRLELADGTHLDFDKLLLATGAHPRSLPVPGHDADGVLQLRRVGDSDRIKQTLSGIEHLVVVGAGWIGLEVAAAAREAGVAVTVVETAELPLLRVLGREVAEVFAALHRDRGVAFRFTTAVDEILAPSGKVTGVRLTDGLEIEAQAVLVAVGADPDVQLATEAKLRVDNGVLVDATLRTGDPNIVAAGDVANAFHPLLGKQIRVEHWANALNQPAVAASSMLGGDRTYSELPYFFTDQYDLGMEYLGHVDPDGYDEVLFRGDVEAREFIAFWLSEGRVVAGMNVNIWDVGEQIKTLITSATTVDRQALEDLSVPLNEHIAR
ncbi:NAD(P)/FAD-dependent oxidoreductase [Saccharopolyspora flava]|uniref:3-phenylpropionate/trans-cinnamate dioxygenase ferredoxin reductase subunit n=1 Tax=Saccharopolyspora flava TaxID=95161 RepID=A0A1I6PNK2_9PSEU|nr:FAD-dependent oxidoreductase [Saccharopolyspora flava]SFS41782.1 3-phenylpropionate/trans-cinnamate dioxygenase ferredoxin reductase subunit [Saccharopolyspora flava]